MLGKELAQAALLYHICSTEGQDSIELWKLLDKRFLNSHFSAVYDAIHKGFTAKDGGEPKFPSLSEIQLSARSDTQKKAISVILESTDEYGDISGFVCAEFIKDEYFREKFFRELATLLENTEKYGSGYEEISSEASAILIDLDREFKTDSDVYNFMDLNVYSTDRQKDFIPLKIANGIDATIEGVLPSELVVFGGHRGSGKSLTCSNIAISEAKAGFVVPYMTIEMRADQVHRRNLAIEAGVSAQGMRKNKLTDEETLKVAELMCSKVEGGDKFLPEFSGKLEELFDSLSSLPPKGGQVIIIDNPSLSMNDIDTYLFKLKAEHGDNLRMVIVDYVNQVVLSHSKSHDQYDWKVQVSLTKELKALAAKYEVAIISPIQTKDETDKNSGKNLVKFSKALEDSVDVSFLMSASKEQGGYLKFVSTKTRDTEPFSAVVGIDWNTLRIDPAEKTIVEEEKTKDSKPLTEAGEAAVRGDFG